MPGSQEQDRYEQPFLAGFEDGWGREESLLEHVVVETLPTFTQRKSGGEWECIVYAQPDIFNQERSEYYHVQASRVYAREAKRKKLRPGDLVNLTDRHQTQEITLSYGRKEMINYITVSNIEVLARVKRTSLTVYERQRGRQ